MGEPRLPAGLVEARRTPLFDYSTLPDPLAASHRTTVWAELRVQEGTVRYVDLEGDSPRDERVGPGEAAVIVPGVEHHVEPSTDARFYVQFFREPDAAMVPGDVQVDTLDRSGAWEHRGRDLDTPEEIVEMVTRQYVDVGQDDLLQPYFNFGPGFIDWQAHIGAVADIGVMSCSTLPVTRSTSSKATATSTSAHHSRPTSSTAGWRSSTTP